MNISGRAISVTAWIVAFAALLHYAFYQLGYAVNADNALMIEYAKRWLAGGTYGIDVFDPNPPASFLIYIPAVLLSKIMSVWVALTLYTSVLLTLSSAAVWLLLKGCKIDEGGRRVITFAYVLGNIFLANVFYGERDHLIFLGVVPLCLLQYAMLQGCRTSGCLKYPVLIAGVVAIAVKPHFALMPVLMIGYRIFKSRNLNAVWEVDTKALIIGGVVYAAILAIFFPEFIRDVLPAASMIYAPDLDEARLAVNMTVTFVAGLAWLVYSTGNSEKVDRQFTNFLMIFSFCLTLSALAQLKGFYYHALPQFIMIFIMAAYMLYQFCKGIEKVAPYAVSLSVIGLVAISYAVMPPAPSFPTHDTFKESKIKNIFSDCPQPCSVFIFDEYPDIAVMASVYNESTFASRFPSYWFLPEIYAEEGLARDKYQAMVAEDLIRHKPDILALIRTEIELPDKTTVPFDYIEFFSGNMDFAQEIKKYEKTGTFEMDRADYHRGTTMGAQDKETFDLYRRRGVD